MDNIVIILMSEHIVLCFNVLFLVLSTVLLVVLYFYNHREEILWLEEEAKRTGLFRKERSLTGRIAAIRTYSILRRAKLEQCNSLMDFIKDRVEKDPNNRGWKNGPIHLRFLSEFTADYEARYFERLRERSFDKKESDETHLEA